VPIYRNCYTLNSKFSQRFLPLEVMPTISTANKIFRGKKKIVAKLLASISFTIQNKNHQCATTFTTAPLFPTLAFLFCLAFTLVTNCSSYRKHFAYAHLTQRQRVSTRCELVSCEELAEINLAMSRSAKLLEKIKKSRFLCDHFLLICLHLFSIFY